MFQTLHLISPLLRGLSSLPGVPVDGSSGSSSSSRIQVMDNPHVRHPSSQQLHTAWTHCVAPPRSCLLSRFFSSINTNRIALIVYLYYTYQLWYFRNSFAAYCAFNHDLWPQKRSQFVSVFCLHQWFIFCVSVNLTVHQGVHSVLSFIISGHRSCHVLFSL